MAIIELRVCDHCGEDAASYVLSGQYRFDVCAPCALLGLQLALSSMSRDQRGRWLDQFGRDHED